MPSGRLSRTPPIAATSHEKAVTGGDNLISGPDAYLHGHPTRNRVAGLEGTLEGRLRYPIRAEVFGTVDGKKLA